VRFPNVGADVCPVQPGGRLETLGMGGFFKSHRIEFVQIHEICASLPADDYRQQNHDSAHFADSFFCRGSALLRRNGE
jgi:hypothetical protein